MLLRDFQDKTDSPAINMQGLDKGARDDVATIGQTDAPQFIENMFFGNGQCFCPR